jgi:hypothetical protein
MDFNLRRAVPLAMATALVVTLAVSVGWSVRADDDGPAEARCSNRTLRGDYGFSIDGQILAGPRTGLLRGLAMTHFDGTGILTQVDYATINGVPAWSDWRPVSGTYDLNPNCTGTAEFTANDGSPTIHLRLIVVNRGSEIRTIVEGNATGSTGIKVR